MNRSGGPNASEYWSPSLNLSTFVRRSAGESVKMLNGIGFVKANVTDDMVKTAIARLETGFAFVGLVEEWPLSVCLFHKMFGGRPHKREFVNTRPGNVFHPGDRPTDDVPVDTADLEGYTDPYDGQVYAKAHEIFWANVEKYGATQQACQELCGHATSYFTNQWSSRLGRTTQISL